APVYGYRPEAIEITEIGPRMGEKLYEELLAESEVPRSYEDDELIVYLGEEQEAEAFIRRPYMQAMRRVTGLYHSERIPQMPPSQIEDFLVNAGLLPVAAPAGARA